MAASVNTVIPLGPDYTSYQTLKFGEEENEVFWCVLFCSVLLGA